MQIFVTITTAADDDFAMTSEEVGDAVFKALKADKDKDYCMVTVQQAPPVPAMVGDASGASAAADRAACLMAHPVRVKTSEGWQDVAQGATGPPGPPGAGVSPTGSLMAFAGTTPPTGFLLCDGTAVDRTAYAALFAVIGTAYGAGNGTTTFNLPNLKGRIPVGVDPAQPEFDARGDQGGAKAVALGASHLPVHGHSIPAEAPGTGYVSADHAHWVGDAGAHDHGPGGGGGFAKNAGETFQHATGTGGTRYNVVTYTSGTDMEAAHAHGWTGGISANHTHTVNSHSHGGATGNVGADGAHENMPPYVAVNWIIKT